MGKIKPPERPNQRFELRIGRNFVRKGDLIKVRPPDDAKPGTHGYWARFQYVDVDKGGLYACVFMLERGEKGVLQYCGIRCVKPERIQRTATTHDPLNRAAAKAAAKRGDSNA